MAKSKQNETSGKTFGKGNYKVVITKEDVERRKAMEKKYGKNGPSYYDKKK